jgi:hypothetical protein
LDARFNLGITDECINNLPKLIDLY